MIPLILKIVAIIVTWGSMAALSSPKTHSLFYYLGMLAVSLLAVAMLNFSFTLETSSPKEIVGHWRTWSLTARLAATRIIMIWFLLVPPAVVSILLLYS